MAVNAAYAQWPKCTCFSISIFCLSLALFVVVIVIVLAIHALRLEYKQFDEFVYVQTHRRSRDVSVDNFP